MERWTFRAAIDDLFLFNGHANNVNYLVVNGVKIAQCMQEGTSEEVPLTTMLAKLGIDIPDILQTVAQFDE